ncbi:aminotransferase class III-fold pyridoxal phosphate-dependent enzyme [Variovorax defluvii]|uniref:Aminotransferase class III-fold pyridoxal phosphate-dependent enzyme n=1 Tax=Variovorax defluvii TaxID=913761 RepID=A0ABP8I185_9BURK
MNGELASSGSAQLWERALKAMPGGVSHDGRFLPPHPTYFARAKGARKWDVEGREYIDYAVGSGAMMLGHSHPDVVKAVQAQMELGTFFATVHPLEIEWAELVQELIPSAERVRFTASGTESTLLAIRTARAYTGKPKLLRFEGHFHGWHDGVLLGMKAPFDEWPSLGIPDELRSTAAVAPQDANRVEEMLKADPAIGTIICEVSGANWGSVPISDDFLRDLRKLADRYGCVLIFDEVITGFRWSPGGKQKLLGITPDMTTMAKIVAGGMPGGAVGGKAEIMRLLDPNVEYKRYKPAVAHKGTYNASPIVSAAAVAALKVIRTGEPQRQADSVAKQLRAGMQQMIDELGVDALVYGESSTFTVYFAKGARRGSLASISPAAIRGSLNRDSLDIYTNGLRRRGVDNMSFTGGMTSLAHRDEDVPPTLEAFEGAVQDLLDAGRIVCT